MTRDGAIYSGTVRHRRLGPRTRSFAQPLFCLYLNVDAIDRAVDELRLISRSRLAPLSYRRSDYLGPSDLSIGQAVRRELASKIGVEDAGPIYMLTQLRSFGHLENPVTFYYVFHATEDRLAHVIAEITNTPWRERHRYVLTEDENLGDERTLRFRFGKEFHVSPFQPMDLSYDWRFSTPGEGLVVHMTSNRGGVPYFDATLQLRRKPLVDAELARALLKHPCMSARIAARTYFEAARLLLGGNETFPHPSRGRPRGGACPHEEAS